MSAIRHDLNLANRCATLSRVRLISCSVSSFTTKRAQVSSFALKILRNLVIMRLEERKFIACRRAIARSAAAMPARTCSNEPQCCRVSRTHQVLRYVLIEQRIRIRTYHYLKKRRNPRKTQNDRGLHIILLPYLRSQSSSQIASHL